MHFRYRRPQHHFIPLTDIQAAAIVDDRDYIPKVYGAAPAIVFTFRDMENVASIRRVIEDKRFALEHSITIEINESYRRSKKPRSAKQIAAGRRWTARMNDDGDNLHGYDDGECRLQNDRPADYYV